MKARAGLSIGFTVCLSALSGELSIGQGTFQDLDFESGNVPPPTGGSFDWVSTASALPGWTAWANGTWTEVLLDWSGLVSYNYVSLEGSGEPVIDGNYSVFLYGTGTWISQTGTIPANDNYLTFSAYGAGMTVSFADHTLSPTYLSTGFNSNDGVTFQRYYADISAFSGQTGPLTFTVTSQSNPAEIGLDDIAFWTTFPDSPPQLIGVGNQVVDVSQTLTITNYAYSPSKPISFNLASNSPAGASITTDGIFTWEPICEQGSSTNAITVWATDSGSPPLSNSMTFSVVVGACVEVGIGSTAVLAGQSLCVPVTLSTTAGLSALNFTVNDLDANWTFTPNNALAGSMDAIAVGQSNTELIFGPQIQGLQGSIVLGSICSETPSGASLLVPLRVTAMGASVSNGNPGITFLQQSGQLIVVGRQPVLQTSLDSNLNTVLTLYGQPGTYTLLSTSNIDGGSWSSWTNATLSEFSRSINLGHTANQMQFFEAVQP